MSLDILDADGKLALACWHCFRDKTCYPTGGPGTYWAWGCTRPLPLDALILEFAKFGPTFFLLELCGNHLAIRVFDDVVLVGVAQITEQSWPHIQQIYQVAQQGAVEELWSYSTVRSDLDNKEAAHVGTSLH